MHAKDFAVNDSCQSKKVKNLAARLPYRRVSIFGLAFFVEAVNLRDLPGLVVSSNKSNAVGVSIGVRMSIQAPPTEYTLFLWGDMRAYLALRHIRSVNVSRLK